MDMGDIGLMNTSFEILAVLISSVVVFNFGFTYMMNNYIENYC